MMHSEFRIYGDGSPVVLIPGFASKANSWGFQYRWLKRYFKVITFEIKGIDESGLAMRNCNLRAAVDYLSEILASSGISKTALVGSSMGAMAALEFARKYPEKVLSIIAVSLPVAYNATFGQLSEMISSCTANEFSLKYIMPLFFSPAFVKHERFKIITDFFLPNGSSFSKEILSSQLGMIREWIESKRWVEGCQCPSLFIYGSEDQLVSKEEALRQLAPIFNKSEFKVIDGAGHAVHIERYSIFNEILRDFLTRNNS